MAGVSGSIFLIFSGFQAIAGSRSQSLSINNVLVDLSNKDDEWIERETGKKDWTVSINGVVAYSGFNGESLSTIAMGANPIFQFAWGDEMGNLFYQGEGFIESVELEAGDDEAASYTVTIAGNNTITRFVN